MRNVRGHECIKRVLAFAGVDITDKSYSESASEPVKPAELVSEEDKAIWVREERKRLERLRAQKRLRRNEMACNFSQSPLVKLSGLRDEDDVNVI